MGAKRTRAGAKASAKAKRGQAEKATGEPTEVVAAPPDTEPPARNAGSDAENSGTESDATEPVGGSWPVDRLQPVVEALLFAAADPVSPRKLAGCVPGSTADEVRAAIQAIHAQCEGSGVRLVEVAGGWQLRTAPEYHEYVRHLFKQKQFRLTRAGIETVAIVAYRQPATRAEIEEVRGVDCSGVLESLVERGVVRIAGRRDVPGRPLVYVTTAMFLEMFGLKDLKGLPTLAELGDDIRGLADTAGFEAGDERDAAILPLEDSASGDEGRSQNDGKESGVEGDAETTVPKLSFARRGTATQRNENEARDDGESNEPTDAVEEDAEPRDGR